MQDQPKPQSTGPVKMVDKNGVAKWVAPENVEPWMSKYGLTVVDDEPSPGMRPETAEESEWTDHVVPTALRVVPAIAGAAVGSLLGPFGTAAGGAGGASLGEYLAQKYEVPGENDVNLAQVGVQGVLGAMPVGKIAQIPGIRQGANRLARTAAGRVFAKSATASTPAQRVVQQLPRTMAKSTVEGAVLGGVSGAPTRAAAGQPTTMEDIVRDVVYGAAVGGAVPLAGRGAILAKDIGARGVGWAARNPAINTLASGAVSAGTGYVARSGGPDSIAVGAYGGWKLAQTALNKLKKLGLPDTPSGKVKGYNKSPGQILEDIEEVAKAFESIDSLSVDIQAADMKRFADGVEYVLRNGKTVSPSAMRQLDRVKDIMLTPKANAALQRMSADEFLDENGLIDIALFTDAEALKYHNTLAEAIDSASRAGRPVTEKWRQAFEGLRERVQSNRSRDYASAMDSLVDPSIADREAFELALKALPTAMQGEILQNDLALINTLRRNLDLSGGTLVQGQGADKEGLVEILRSMSRPIRKSIDPTPPRGGAPGDPSHTVPTEVAIQTGPGSATSTAVNPANRGGTLVPASPKTSLGETVESLRTPDQSQLPNAQVIKLAKGASRSGSTVPPKVNYDQYKPGSGAATPEVGRPTGTGTPIAPGGEVVRDAAEDAVSTVESRAQARGAAPEVASVKQLTPDNIRELLSNRPGLDAAILAQKLVGKPKIANPQNKLQPDYERFSRLYKELSGSPPTEDKHYSPSHVLGLYYASGMNKTKAERSLIKRIITAVLKQPGMGSQESIDRLLDTMEKAG
jgi:hypothetical protein